MHKSSDCSQSYLQLPTLLYALYWLCMRLRRRISTTVSRVSCQDSLTISCSIRTLLMVLRTNRLQFSATVRPILSTSECRREARLPERGMSGGRETEGEGESQ